jgi:hypothetical protein
VDSFEALSLIRSVQVPGALPDAVTGVITSTESGGSMSALKKLFRWWASARKLVEVIRDWEEDEVCCMDDWLEHTNKIWSVHYLVLLRSEPRNQSRT